MRRRRTVWPDKPPASLLSFDPADWPGETDRESFELWASACKSFCDDRGWQGGPLALLRLIRQTRQDFGLHQADR